MPEFFDTGGDGCSPQDYFFKKSQEVITIDEDHNRVGINNTNPQYDLDVNGTIATSNLIADGLVLSSNILNTGQVETHTVLASNITSANITASQFLQGLTINAESNLCWGGHRLYEPYPQDQQIGTI